MKRNILFLVITAIILLTMAPLFANTREEIIPLPFIGPKVVLSNMVFVEKDGGASIYTITPQTIHQVVEALKSSVDLANNFEMPDRSILRKINLYWNVNTSGVYSLDERDITIRGPWGEIVSKNCEDVTEEIITTDKQRLGTVVHEFAHAIFHQNIKKESINVKKHWTLISGYNEMFADSFSVLVMNDLEITKGCQNSRSFKRSNETNLLSEKYNYRGHPYHIHVVFDPVRLAFGDLIQKNSLPSNLLIEALFYSIVKSIKSEILLKEQLPYIERNKLFIKNLEEEFESFLKG